MQIIKAAAISSMAIILLNSMAFSQDSLSILSAIPQAHNTSFGSGYSGLIAPAIFLGLAIHLQTEDDILINQEVKAEAGENYSGFHSKADNFLQFAPIAEGLALHFAGYKAADGLGRSTWKLTKAELLMVGMVTVTKNATHSRRPDSGGNNSFPSGHTAQAFLAAAYLHSEYGHHHPLVSITGYAMATTVGAMRVLNNRHWATDVLAGAGYGLLSWQLVNLTDKGKFFKNDPGKLAVAPYYDGNITGVNALYKF